MESSNNINFGEKIKLVFEKVPFIFYIIFFIIIMCLYFYTTSGLNILNKMSGKNIENKNKHKNNIDILFKNHIVRLKYIDLVKILGEPTLIEMKEDYITESVTWKLDLDSEEFKYGKYNGLDYIRLNGYVARKNHPIPAPVFVIVGKYINVPEHLYGPLKYASPTINIEQIYIPQKHNLHYEKTGEKKVSLVTGSCASITISAITLKFVEDMIKEYKNNINTTMDIHEKFRNEYNLRVLTYLCGKGIQNKISWFSPDNFNEPEIYNSGSDKCYIFTKDKKPATAQENNEEVSKILRSIDNTISKNHLSQSDIKNLLEDKDKPKKQKEEKIKGGSCKNHELKKDCEASSHCFWDGECNQKFCHEATDKDTCESDEVYAAKCYWDNMDQNNKCKHLPS
jgi:hypothetical protein